MKWKHLYELSLLTILYIWVLFSINIEYNITLVHTDLIIYTGLNDQLTTIWSIYRNSAIVTDQNTFSQTDFNRTKSTWNSTRINTLYRFLYKKNYVTPNNVWFEEGEPWVDHFFGDFCFINILYYILALFMLIMWGAKKNNDPSPPALRGLSDSHMTLKDP